MDALKLNDLHSREALTFELLTPEELEEVIIPNLEAEIANLKVRMNTMQPKLNVLKEYYKLVMSFDFALEWVWRKQTPYLPK